MPSLPAQRGRLAPPDTTACAGRTVTDIAITALPPYPNGIFRRWRALSDLLQRVHVITRPEVVRRFLRLDVGDVCRPLDLAESERILRAQPFLADARITAVDDSAGGVRLEVLTRDEVSLQGAIAVNAQGAVRAASIGNSNLQGGAVFASVRWQQGDVYRDVYGVKVVDYQLLNRVLQAEVNAVRGRLGGEWMTQFGHPFLTDLQRVAWRASIGESRLHYAFVRPDSLAPAIGVEWTFRDIGGVFRIGEPGRLSLFGGSLSREESWPDRNSIHITSAGVRPAGDTLIERYPRRRSARVNALWGVRNIRFVRVRGFDALDNVQDVRRGFQLGTLAGRSLGVLGSRNDDIFVAADLYMGAGTPRVFAGVQVIGEGRQDYDLNRWDDILATGRAAVYVKPHPFHTLIVSAEYSEGWRQLVPFQLTLGEFDAGVRGYRDAPLGGSQRLVFRGEERWFWGHPFNLADGGTAVFYDLGRIRAGDSPHGMDTGWRSSVGISLLAGVPPRSKRLWRLDFVYPLADGAVRTVEVRISNRDNTRTFWREPPDVRRSRGRTLPTSVFNWP